MKNKKKIIILFSAFIIIVIALYRYGADIPLINKIPIFKQHEHVYRPVLDESGDIDYWTCNMHPSVKLKDPGTCPICGMDTVPVMKKSDISADEPENGDKMDGHDHSAMGMQNRTKDESEVKSTFPVSPERQQLIGVKTEPVVMRDMDKEIRTVGMVTLDESKIYNIQTRYSGWIEEVYVDYTWQHVSKGEPLFSIYSPELVTAQEEYLLAYKSKNILGGSEYPEISGGAKSLLKASRRKLELLGVSPRQIREIERTGEVKSGLTVYSPVRGRVAKKNVFENLHVEPNTVLYKIADHTTVWVEVEVYEDEITLVNLGVDAVMTVPSMPGEVFEGKVTFIWPHIEPATRTVKARLEFPNPDLRLLPEMYADVTLMIPTGDSLTVPASAVLRTGKQDIVFVDRGNGKFEIRKVGLGLKAGQYYEVLRGLKAGETVVSTANFLIDSESKVQAAVATWGNEDGGDDEGLSDDGSGPAPGDISKPKPGSGEDNGADKETSSKGEQY